MILSRELKTIEDFENLKNGDWLACEFHQNIHDYPKTYRFNVFKIAKVRLDTNEIILQMKNNIYFNYKMFNEGKSNLKSCILISNEY